MPQSASHRMYTSDLLFICCLVAACMSTQAQITSHTIQNTILVNPDSSYATQMATQGAAGGQALGGKGAIQGLVVGQAGGQAVAAVGAAQGVAGGHAVDSAGVSQGVVGGQAGSQAVGGAGPTQGMVGGLASMIDPQSIDQVKKPRVEFLHSAPGFSRAHTDESMEPLYRDNLEADLAYWKSLGRPLGVRRDLLGQRDLLRHRAVCVIVIKDNSFFLFRQKSAPPYMVKRARGLVRSLIKSHLELNTTFPDTFFYFNMMDLPACAQFRDLNCSAPVFTIYKHWNTSTNSMLNDTEVAIPHFTRQWGNLYNFPWEHKNPRAMMRSYFQRSMHANSTRLQIALLGMTHSHELDAGIVGNRNKEVQLPPAAQRGYISMKRHPLWKLLINTNGHVASSRLGELLQMNSLIISESSDWVEYYYRSIKAGEHYLTLDLPSLISQIKQLQSADNPRAKIIVASAQQFGYTYLSAQSKVLYMRQALIRYNNLFGGEMERFVKALDLPEPTVGVEKHVNDEVAHSGIDVTTATNMISQTESVHGSLGMESDEEKEEETVVEVEPVMRMSRLEEILDEVEQTTW